MFSHDFIIKKFKSCNCKFNISILTINYFYRVKVEESRTFGTLNVMPHAIWMGLSTNTCIAIYAVLITLTIVQALSRSFVFFTICMRASVKFVLWKWRKSAFYRHRVVVYLLQAARQDVSEYLPCGHEIFQHEHVRQNFK